MKNLDSLALMLLVSSGIVFDSSAQTEPTKEMPVMKSAAANVSAADPPANPHKLKKQHGTFSASHLFWSHENHEVYLNGLVRVDVGENHFGGDGSFSFLGPVYLLAIDGDVAKPGSTIMLSDDKYRLVTLSEKEATKKYGEDGRFGAVEITAAN